MLLVQLLVLLPSAALCASSVVEVIPTYQHLIKSVGKSLLCDKCPPGTRLAAHCTPSTPTRCVPCEENHFTEVWNYLPKCLFCGNFCNENQEVEKECSATSNRVCRCKEGFYLSAHFCFGHSQCKPGQGVKTKGTSTADTVCEHCADGYFSNSSSTTDPCVKHQECAPGQGALLDGSIYNDAVCGTCEDLATDGRTFREFISGFFSTNRMRTGKMKRFLARFNRNSVSSVPARRGALLEQITSFLAQTPLEQLRKLPAMLRSTRLNSVADKLEKTFSDIKQRNSNCTFI